MTVNGNPWAMIVAFVMRLHRKSSMETYMGTEGYIIPYSPTPVMAMMAMAVVMVVVMVMVVMILFHPSIFMMINDVMFMMT